MKEKKVKDPARVKAGKKSRGKGRANEQQLAIIIAGHFGCSTDTKDKYLPNYYLNHCKRTARDRQVGIGDLWTSETLQKVFPFIAEAKDYAKWNLETLFGTKNLWFKDWWDQAVEQSVPTSQPPILIFTKSFAPQYVCFRERDTPVVVDESSITIMTLVINNEKLVIMKLDDFLSRYYNGINIINS
jgi:hypothetical protein